MARRVSLAGPQSDVQGRMLTATTGTGTLSLGAAATNATTFAAMPLPINDGDQITYELVDLGVSPTAKEKGVGTYHSAGPTLSRDTVIWSTNGNAKLNLSGNAFVFVAADESDVVLSSALGPLTAHAVLLGEGAAPIGTATVGTLGRVLTDLGAGVDPAFALPGPPGARTLLTGPATRFIATNGNDSNDGLTSGTPWATFAHARSVLAGQLDFGGQTVTLQAVAGHAAFTEQLNLFSWVGGGSFIYDGGGGSIATTSQDAVFCGVPLGGNVTIQNVALSNSGSGFANCIAHAGTGSIIIGSGIGFGASLLYHMVASGGGAAIKLSAPYTITGNAPRHMGAFVNALMISFANPNVPTGQTVSITGSRTFSYAFATADGASNLAMNGMTYQATGGGAPSVTTPNNQRAVATGNAIIYTGGGGGTYFPGTGNTPGFTSGSGGQYT